MANYVFFTRKNQQAVQAEMGDRKFNQMESLARACVRNQFRRNILFAVDSNRDMRETELTKVTIQTQALNKLAREIQMGRSHLPAGCKNAKEIYDLSNFTMTSAASGMKAVLAERYPDAFKETSLMGMDRAFLDGVPNVALEELFVFYTKFRDLYRTYAHLKAPFLVDVYGTVRHDELRQIAAKTGDQRFYGMATSAAWYDKARMLLDSHAYLREMPYSEAAERSKDASPAGAGVMLGLMMAYLAANNNGDKMAGLSGVTPDNSGKSMKIHETFYMNIMKVSGPYNEHYVLTYGEADKQQMLFVVPDILAEDILDIVAYSKGQA